MLALPRTRDPATGDRFPISDSQSVPDICHTTRYRFPISDSISFPDISECTIEWQPRPASVVTRAIPGVRWVVDGLGAVDVLAERAVLRIAHEVDLLQASKGWVR